MRKTQRRTVKIDMDHDGENKSRIVWEWLNARLY